MRYAPLCQMFDNFWCRVMLIWNLPSHPQGFIHLFFDLHPWKLTWNPKMKVWNMSFLFKQVIFRFHVEFQGCSCSQLMVNFWFGAWWFGILRVLRSNNPFHKGILGIQTTNPNHQSIISCLFGRWKNRNTLGFQTPNARRYEWTKKNAPIKQRSPQEVWLED